MTSDPIEIYSAMLSDALGSHLEPSAKTFVQMFAEDGVLEFPFAFGKIPKRLEGREALAAHLDRIAGLVAFSRISLLSKRETSEPGVIIIEFEGVGQNLETGEPYDQRYVSVVRIRNAHIAHYTEYWNPIALLRTLKGDKFVESLIGT